jgi:uncharacterized membrane protein YkvI
MRPIRRVTGALGALPIAATYVSTIVGAGFASGQEVLRFFSHFGPYSFGGLLVAALLLGSLGPAIMLLSRRASARTHGDLLEWLGGPWFGRFYDVVITVFLLGTTAVMIAGSGVLLREQLGLPLFAGDLIMAAAAVATVLVGLRGVVVASEVVVVLLLGSIAIMVGAVLSGGGGSNWPWWSWWRPEEAVSPSWIVSAFLYASYNLFLTPGVLAPLAARATSSRAVMAGGLLGGLALGLAAAGVNLLILTSLPDAAAFEAPVLYAAGRLGGLAAGVLRPLVGLVLWAEVYTTAVSLLYGVALRLAGGGSRGPRGGSETPRFRAWVWVCGFVALATARAGFSNLVVTLYPLTGYAAVGFLVVVIYRLIRPPCERPAGPARKPEDACASRRPRA